MAWRSLSRLLGQTGPENYRASHASKLSYCLQRPHLPVESPDPGGWRLAGVEEGSASSSLSSSLASNLGWRVMTTPNFNRG